MPTVTRTFRVQTPPDRVLAYLEDFSHAEEWDPGTVSCTRLDDGPVRVGSRWRNVSKVLGRKAELTYELLERTDDRVVFRGENDGSVATDDIRVRPYGGGSELRYQVHIELKGLAKLAGPAMRLYFEKVGNDVVQELTAAVERR